MRPQITKLTPFALALALLAGTPALAQKTVDDLAAQIEELKKGQDQIRQQLQQITRQLQQRQAPAPAAPSGPQVAGKVFDLGDNPVKGASTAKLTLVEFTDYQ